MDIDEKNFIKLKNKPKVHYILQNTTLLHLGFQFFSLAALKNWKLKLLSLKKTLIKPSDSASNPFPFLKLSVPFSCFPVHMNKRHAFCKLTHETLRSKTIFRPCRSIQRVELRWDFEKKNAYTSRNDSISLDSSNLLTGTRVLFPICLLFD